MDIQAYCDKSQTLHAVNVLENQEPPPPIPADCEESFWIKEIEFGSERYNVVSKLKKKHMPRVMLDNGATIVISFKLSGANGHG